MLSEATIASFRASLRGQLITPTDSQYDEARKVYNAMIDRRPGLIARCVDVADVALWVNTPLGSSVPDGVGDPNGDGTINLADLTIIQADFGKCCPEPASVVMFVVGLCGLVIRPSRRNG